MGAVIFRLCVLSFLCWSAGSAQGARDEWKQLGKPFDLEAHLTHSLSNAPLTAAERSQIYRLIDDKTIHDSFTDEQRGKERETVLSARVGLIMLADHGSEQVVVQGPALFCGANGNCSIRIFTRESGRLRLVLETGGGIFIVSKTSSRGFHDLATGWHMGSREERFGVYRWDGSKYTESDCYDTQFDVDDPEKPPKIEDCPGRPPQTSPQR
jgi:hypothetical protein